MLCSSLIDSIDGHFDGIRRKLVDMHHNKSISDVDLVERLKANASRNETILALLRDSEKTTNPSKKPHDDIADALRYRFEDNTERHDEIRTLYILTKDNMIYSFDKTSVEKIIAVVVKGRYESFANKEIEFDKLMPHR
jgi:hypothetical protein